MPAATVGYIYDSGIIFYIYITTTHQESARKPTQKPLSKCPKRRKNLL